MADYQGINVALVAAAYKWATLYEMNCGIDNLVVGTVLSRMKVGNKPLLWYYEEASSALCEKKILQSLQPSTGVS